MPRILIVDDEPQMVRGLEDNLRFEGYQTLSAADGKRGLDLALSEAPDLILLDIMMPGMSGWDVCRRMRDKGLDLIVGNRVGGPFDAIGSDENKVIVFGAEGVLSDWPMLPKRQVAERLWDLIVDRYRKAHPAERPARPARATEC